MTVYATSDRLIAVGAEPDHPWGWLGWNLKARASIGARTARHNENSPSRIMTTLGPEISREKICGLLKFAVS